MRRSAAGLDAVADWDGLIGAFHRAARAKRTRLEVALFANTLEDEIASLRRDILSGQVAVGDMKRFSIRDPKPRIIHAPCFRERVLHHALMAVMGPVLERGLVHDVYACRTGKGAIAAVNRAKRHLARFPWYGQIDIKGYFPSIDHEILLALLGRKFKNEGLLNLVARIVRAHKTLPGKGLPIGALTSQNFANAYLNGADRHLLEDCKVGGYVRYMDDLVWWGTDRAAVRSALQSVTRLLQEDLKLVVKTPVTIGRSVHGLNFCGYRIFGDRILLSRRRKARYRACRRAHEHGYLAERCNKEDLQAGYASARAITLHADSLGWRRAELIRHPLAPELAEI